MLLSKTRVKLNAYMTSCRARDQLRDRTVANLEATDWQGRLTIELDEGGPLPQMVRHTALVRRVLRRALQDPNSVFLFLEDDLEFNRSLVHNLSVWLPLSEVTPGRHFYASLYNPGVTFVRSFTKAGYAEASLRSVFGSQALVIGKATVRYLLTCWGVESWPIADVRLARLAARVCPLLYHIPSLVQHVGTESLWDGPFHCAADFDRDWKAATPAR